MNMNKLLLIASLIVTAQTIHGAQQEQKQNAAEKAQIINNVLHVVIGKLNEQTLAKFQKAELPAVKALMTLIKKLLPHELNSDNNPVPKVPENLLELDDFLKKVEKIQAATEAQQQILLEYAVDHFAYFERALAISKKHAQEQTEINANEFHETIMREITESTNI